MNNFDLIIIGGGAGGIAAAIKANELGKKAVVFNHGLPIGGTCVNVGCVPSKALVHTAETVYNARFRKVPGIDIELRSFDFGKIIEEELALVDILREEKYEKVLQSLDHVTVVESRAKFIDKNTVEADGEKYTAAKFIISTGSKAVAPPIKGLDEVGYITHIEALKEKVQPKSLTIIGAGPVGLEFAQVFSRLGTKITMLVRGSSIFSGGEGQVTEMLKQILVKEGIEILTDTKITEAKKIRDKKVIVYKSNGNSTEIESDEILIATGKKPNTKDLGLENAYVKVDDKGAIEVKSTFQTSNENIYAVGDVASLPMRLETTAGKEGTMAAENALTKNNKSIDYNIIPFTIFTDPEYASVGYTEEEQMEKMRVCSCRSVEFKYLPKARILNREGMIKMAVHPETEVIMGVHILAPNAGDLVAQAMTLIANKNTLDDVIGSTPVFPTLSEAIKLVATSFKKDISKLSCCT